MADNTTGDIIQGDLFSGIVISTYEDKEYLVSDGKIVQKAISKSPDRLTLGFLFLLSEPIRLRLDVLVPENCKNACVTLQDKKLLGYFSEDIPENPEPMIEMPCDNHTSISTLKPGAFQSINFRWESGDVLKFHFYY